MKEVLLRLFADRKQSAFCSTISDRFLFNVVINSWTIGDLILKRGSCSVYIDLYICTLIKASTQSKCKHFLGYECEENYGIPGEQRP